jgi:hypothetical protein
MALLAERPAHEAIARETGTRCATCGHQPRRPRATRPARRCAHCGEWFTPRSELARYCKPGHRVAAARKRARTRHSSVDTARPIP